MKATRYQQLSFFKFISFHLCRSLRALF